MLLNYSWVGVTYLLLQRGIMGRKIIMKKKNVRNYIFTEVCLGRGKRKTLCNMRELKERVWPEKTGKTGTTRSKPHTQTRAWDRHQIIHVCLLTSDTPGKNVSFPKDVHTLTQAHSRVLLSAGPRLSLSESGRHVVPCANVCVSVSRWCGVTGCMSDDNDNDDDGCDGLGWVKLAAWLRDKGKFPGKNFHMAARRSWSLLSNWL